MESNNLGVNGRNDDALLTSGNRIKQLNDIDKVSLLVLHGH